MQAADHGLRESVEQRQQIMRTRAGFGMTLELKAALSAISMPCNEPSNSDTCVGRTFAGRDCGSTAKPWFWLVIINPLRGQVLHGMVGTVMTELHLHGVRARPQGKQLMPQADAEHRDIVFRNSRIASMA